MQKALKYVVTALIVLAIVAFMTTYSVRFNETAVVTTFGKAGPDSVRDKPGMGFRWPYPIQQVIKYDTRASWVAALPQNIATKDESQIIVSAFATWRVKDPLKFYEKFGRGSRPQEHIREADNAVRSSLHNSMSRISAYRLDELLTTRGGQSKLPEVERLMKESLTTANIAGGAGDVMSQSGIEIMTVGIYGIQMPETITKSFFDAMKTNRLKISASALSEGEASASAIRNSADASQQTIMAFVQQHAKSIRAQGDLEAQQYLKEMAAEPDLAVFLRALDFLREGIGKQVTLVWPMSAPGMGVFNPTTVLDPRNEGAPKLFPKNFTPGKPTGDAAPASPAIEKGEKTITGGQP